MPDDITNGDQGGQGNTNAAPGAGGGDEGAGAVSWLDALPEDLRGHEALKAMDSPEALVKAHLDLLGKQPQVPEDYTLALPEGIKADEGLMRAFKATAKQAGLTQDQAQAVANVHAEFIKVQNEQWAREMTAAEDSLRKTWGADFDTNLARAQRGLAVAAGDEAPVLATILKATGMGNHPVVAKVGLYIDSLTADDKLVNGQPAGVGRSAAQILFDKSGK